jgi:predicted metal-dependent peptidase
VSKVEEELSRAVLALLEKEPFFAHVLGGVERGFGEAVPTAGVGLRDGRIVLCINPTFFLKGLRTSQERVAVLKHEILHLVLRHIFRRAGSRTDPRRWNLAADLVVNQLVGRPWKLPEGAIVLSLFPGFKPNLTAERYYDLLGQQEALPEAAAHGDHGGWGGEAAAADGGVGDLMVDRLVAQAADRVGRGGDRGWGKLPGDVVEAIEATFARRKPQLDWRRVVRLFGASSRRTRIKATLRQPSARYGTLPGIRVQRLSRLAVAVDTSGSINDDDLAVFFAEIHGMWRTGAEVVVIECDAAVQRVYPYRGKLPKGVAGRGGTAFDPVFAHLRADRRRWDGCLYLTDGCAPEPDIKPPCPLLWVITAGGRTDSTRFGRAVKLPRG